VAGALGQVAGNRDRTGSEIGRQPFERGDLVEIGIAPEVQVGALQKGES
jgi:hypothetical protein